MKARDHIGTHAWLEDSRVTGRQPIRAEWVDGDHRATEITSAHPKVNDGVNP
jgi:hypothetical protein